MKNRIKEFRKEKGLTQAQLGDKVGTSQQNIQRIEAGIAAPRFDLATEICKVLENPFHSVFPGTRKTASPYKTRKPRPEEPLPGDKSSHGTQSEGMDIESEYRFLMFRLRGGYEASIRFSKPNTNRLWKILQRNGPKQFCVFDTDRERILMNLDHLIFSQLLFEYPDATRTSEEKAAGGCRVEIHTYDKVKPFIFDVKADCKSLGDETAYWEEIQFQEICETASTRITGSDDDEVFMFADADGETAFFRANDVAMMKIPLEVI